MAKDDEGTKPAGDGGNGDEGKPAGDTGADDERAKVMGELGDLIEERVDAVLERRGFSKPKDNGKPAGEGKARGFLESIFGA